MEEDNAARHNAMHRASRFTGIEWLDGVRVWAGFYVVLHRIYLGARVRLCVRAGVSTDGRGCVLDRPDIPLNTNASENDIRAFATKRKISGGTISESGRQARDVMLGLAKTCKLEILFFDYLGARLDIPDRHIPNLATLVSPAATRTGSPRNLPPVTEARANPLKRLSLYRLCRV